MMSRLVMVLLSVWILMASILDAAAANCPRHLGCGVIGCACGDTVVADFTMKGDIVCPADFTNFQNLGGFGLKLASDVTLTGKNATTGVIHKIVGPGNPSSAQPANGSVNYGIWFAPGTVNATARDIEVTGFWRGVEMEGSAASNAERNFLIRATIHHNGNFRATNAHGYGIDVRSSFNTLRNVTVSHSADEGVHFARGATNNILRPGTGTACLVADSGRENIYLVGASATAIGLCESRRTAACRCTADADCGTGGQCGPNPDGTADNSSSPWFQRCVKGAAVACGGGCSCFTGQGLESIRIDESDENTLEGVTVNAGFVGLVGESEGNVLGTGPDLTQRLTIEAGRLDIRLCDPANDDCESPYLYPSGNQINHVSIANPSGDCIRVRSASVNTLVQPTLTCADEDVLTFGVCEIPPVGGGGDVECNEASVCIARCVKPGGASCGGTSGCTCEGTSIGCSENIDCGCAGGHCVMDPSITCSTAADCRRCIPTLPCAECVGGVCAGTSTACTYDTDCARCVGGTCVAGGGSCSSHDDCWTCQPGETPLPNDYCATSLPVDYFPAGSLELNGPTCP